MTGVLATISMVTKISIPGDPLVALHPFAMVTEDCYFIFEILSIGVLIMGFISCHDDLPVKIHAVVLFAMT